MKGCCTAARLASASNQIVPIHGPFDQLTGANLRRPPAKPLPPDDPIFKEGLVIYTPLPARPKPPEKPANDEEPPKE